MADRETIRSQTLVGEVPDRALGRPGREAADNAVMGASPISHQAAAQRDLQRRLPLPLPPQPPDRRSRKWPRETAQKTFPAMPRCARPSASLCAHLR